MLKKLLVQGFYESDNPIDIDFSAGLTILTGDNGAGKTTLLNLIFNILQGDFETIVKSIFKNIILELDVKNFDKKNKSQLVYKIQVQKKAIDTLFVSYFLNSGDKYTIKISKGNWFFDYTYELLQPKLQQDSDKEDKNPFNMEVITSLTELIVKYKKLGFIRILKDNVIYFPTYRRIDSDILQLIEQNYPIKEDVDLSEINKTLSNFPNDRRVVGVTDNDIDHLYKSYSDTCRKLNSEGLDKVLKTFIEEMIKSTYEKKESTQANGSLYEKAPAQLIDLSRQLGISEIKENEIRQYFEKQRKLVEISKRLKFTFDFSTNSEIDVDDKDTVLNSLFSIGENNKLVLRLINLYDNHMKKVNKQLEPYEYLKNNLYKFFKNKINLTFDNYNLKLSRQFKELSTGEKQLITLLSYVALSQNNGLYKPVIIIDEPELSLHISWQIKLLNTLKSLSEANILLATHSPYIANSDYEDYIWQLGDIDEY
ncbi:AAA family ATPase [Paenibacillus sp. PAMC21692]|uniref:AAA family ATPase n=1 Tax=Paenibacillus sp. PAMC21692 TaxID=2762320 RepID=UPI00164D3BB4|nr:AAA family ATPase [Paenibacillus sp. PAMC21692]QNK57324.1 AAA family ATPase [Paenibacillus sp. PAMC21692]